MVSSDEISRRLEAKRRGIKGESRPEMAKIGADIEGKTCLSCGTENPQTAKFCVGCGEKLESPPSEEVFPRIEIKGPGETHEEPEKPGKQVEEETTKEIKITHRPDDFGSTGRPEIKSKSEPVESAADKTPDVMSVIETPPKTPEEKEPEISKPEAPPIPLTPESFKIKTPEPADPKTPEPSTPKTDIDPVERIKRAKELLDIGAITQDEFDIIKKKYLDEI